MQEICFIENCIEIRDKTNNSRMCKFHGHVTTLLRDSLKPMIGLGVVKQCIHHGNLGVSDVYLNGSNNNYQCRICKKNAYLKHKAKNPNRKSVQNFIHIGKNGFKIPVNQYNEMAILQNNLCKICHGPETMKQANGKGIKRLAIDHCHKTNKARGLLCHHCNVSLGGFKDSIELLQSAINYLKEHAPN